MHISTVLKCYSSRVLRNHIAMAAVMVFSLYKVGYATLDHEDLFFKIAKRYHDL